MLLHHCSNFRAWTSVSLNSWNALRQGGLSSDSNNSQPSWLHPSNPDTWSPSLSGLDRISPPACHSLNPGSQETWSICEYRLCILTLMLQPRFLKAVSMLLTSSASFLTLWLPRKFFTTRTNAFHASSSTSFIEFSNSGSLMSCRIWGLSKMPVFNFSRVNPRKAWHK